MPAEFSLNARRAENELRKDAERKAKNTRVIGETLNALGSIVTSIFASPVVGAAAGLGGSAIVEGLAEGFEGKANPSNIANIGIGGIEKAAGILGRGKAGISAAQRNFFNYKQNMILD